LHEKKRFRLSHPPLNGPCFLMASTPYDEHVGVYLQDGKKYGDIAA